MSHILHDGVDAFKGTLILLTVSLAITFRILIQLMESTVRSHQLVKKFANQYRNLQFAGGLNFPLSRYIGVCVCGGGGGGGGAKKITFEKSHDMNAFVSWLSISKVIFFFRPGFYRLLNEAGLYWVL